MFFHSFTVFCFFSCEFLTILLHGVTLKGQSNRKCDAFVFAVRSNVAMV